MKILVVNSGSSSCKYQLLEMENETVICSGLCERIGLDIGRLAHKIAPGTDNEEKIVREQPFPTHKEAMELVIAMLTDPGKGVIKDKSEIAAIGHRVLLGGEQMSAPMLVSDVVKQRVRECFPLGPLHNPANLMGIEVCESLFPSTPNVAVFDSEFGMGMPDSSYMYALPYEYYETMGIRRYGYHGTSHKYIAKKTAQYLNKPLEELRSITMHLGNGSSMTCVRNGRCLDTSMGLTPLEGLIMGTRCGTIDPAIIPYIMNKKGFGPGEMDTLMNKKSGLLGVCGYSDMRDVHAARARGDKKADLAFRMLVHSIRKTLGAYFFLLDGKVDAIVFTAGIGEHDKELRKAVVKDLDTLGVKLDVEANNSHDEGTHTISTPDSRVKILIIPTNEELQIAQAAAEVISK